MGFLVKCETCTRDDRATRHLPFMLTENKASKRGSNKAACTQQEGVIQLKLTGLDSSHHNCHHWAKQPHNNSLALRTKNLECQPANFGNHLYLDGQNFEVNVILLVAYFNLVDRRAIKIM